MFMWDLSEGQWERGRMALPANDGLQPEETGGRRANDHSAGEKEEALQYKAFTRRGAYLPFHQTV